jgi:hypothetical protein
VVAVYQKASIEGYLAGLNPFDVASAVRIVLLQTQGVKNDQKADGPEAD